MYNKAKATGNLQLHFIIKVMGMTGVRVNELESFTTESIQSNSVNVNNKGKIRSVPIPGPLVRELRLCAKNMNIDGLLFDLSYDQIRDGLRRTASLSKVKKSKVNPHSFRHYFGFMFVKTHKERALAQLADILGHGSVETTRIYTRGTIEDYQKSMEEM